MDDEIIYSWCFNYVEFFDSTPSALIIILVEILESLSSLRSQHPACVALRPYCVPRAPSPCAVPVRHTGVLHHLIRTGNSTAIAPSQTRPTSTGRLCYVQMASLVSTDRAQAPQVRLTSPLFNLKLYYFFQYFSHLLPLPSRPILG